MTTKYTEIKLDNGNIIINAILDDGTQLSIPSEPANSDYKAYLAHLTESVTKAK